MIPKIKEEPIEPATFISSGSHKNDPKTHNSQTTSNLNFLEQKLGHEQLQQKWKMVPSFLKVRGLVRQHLDSFNYFIDHEIKDIVRANKRIKCEEDPDWFLEFTDIRVGKPVVDENTGTGTVPIYPHLCRLRDLTYMAPIEVDIIYIKEGHLVRANNVKIGEMPMMLRSSHCHLANCKTDFDYAEKYECPLDPGGYFIINGTEKVILMQEQLSKNRIIVEKDKFGFATANCQSSTHEKKTRCDILIKKGRNGEKRMKLKHNQLTEAHGLPVCIIFKALGIVSDIEIVQLVCGSDQHMQNEFMSSLEECHELRVITQNQAWNYIQNKIKPPLRTVDEQQKSKGGNKWGKVKKMIMSKKDLVKDWLISTLLCHIDPDLGLDMSAMLYRKAVYLAEMVRRVLQTQVDLLKEDDRDYYGNKRLELAGSLMSLLFEDAFKSFQFQLEQSINRHLKRRSPAAAFDPVKEISPETIKRFLIQTISSGNWKIARFGMDRKGATQGMNRLSYMSCMQKMTEIKSQFEKTRKITGPRALQPSQWGMLCPSDTPEGEQCGLTKNIAMMTHITVEVNEEKLIDMVYRLGVEDIIYLTGAEIRHPKNYVVFLNGTILGCTYNPKSLIKSIRTLRRKGYINEFISVYASTKEEMYKGKMTVVQKAVYICSDGGRLCRPYLIVDQVTGQVLLTQSDIDNLEKTGPGTGNEKSTTFNSLLKQGKIEYLDVNEENDCLIAVHQNEVKAGYTTHLEIEPFTLLGVCASLIPYPHHNQSPRNTYQCAMGRQAMGAIAYNQRIRMDTLLYNLTYPQRPLLTTRALEQTSYEKIPAGQNACIAVMSYSGFDIEDALVLNSASLDRGFGRCIVYRAVKTEKRNDPKKGSDKILGPSREQIQMTDNLMQERIVRGHEKLGADGIVRTGAMITSADTLVNKFSPPDKPGGDLKPDPLRWNHTYKGVHYVENIAISENPDEIGSTLVKCLVRQTRRPELGDKFSSRHGQKGVTGYIAAQADMPFSDRGIYPDVIMNPHGYPSRMTVGKLLELLGSKAGAIRGGFHYGTAFGEPNQTACKVEDLRKILTDHHFNFQGKDYLTSGITGEPLEAYIYQGPVYYQKLKHMVADKMQARATGKTTALTRQPTVGRSKDGGLRVGEMERDCLIAYGASDLLLERMMISSDAHITEVCSECGFLSANNWCQRCRSSANVYKIKMPYAAKLLFMEMTSMNVVPKLVLQGVD